MADETKTETTTTTETATQQTGTQPAAGTATPPAASETPADWDAAFAALPEATQKLYEKHVTGLKNTVKALRDEKGTLSDQLRDAAKTADEKTAAALNDLAVKQETAERRASFYEDGATNGVDPGNLRLAWIAARDADLFDRRGNPDWNALKEKFPALFKTTTASPATHAGAGTQTPPALAEQDPIRAALAARQFRP
jgi:hypothetical protein